ncbi:hypothetical protein IC582_008878 [Cucumis melo]|uniref:Uncharacterized protein LOC103487020 n=1 Tax=Cucumis melo TaxID=3656 RepID=A0A1S3B7J2_CUCME|nr:uncharacterized protein LOC103487020 [Cucumis melo]
MPITTTSAAVPAATILFLFIIATATSAPILGLDSFLAQQSRFDPHASNDTFLSLSSSLKKSLSVSSSPPPLIPSFISSLLSLSLSFSLHVRLVGDFPSDSSTHLSSFLSASLPSDHFHVIAPFDSYQHRLAIKHSLHLDVSHAPSLASHLSEILKSEISNTASSLRSSLLAVPYESVDRVIKQDFEKEKSGQGVYIYLLNLGPQSKPYAYNYGHGDSSPGFTKCLGSIWSGGERYLWVDLGAGPVDYGPSLSGDGVLPRGEFHPLATLHGRPKSQKALLADLASLVWSAYQVHLVPSMRIPVPFESSLVVQFIHVYGSESSDGGDLDWKSIERTLRDGGMLLGEQSLSFKHYSVSYAKCPICAFAISRSTNSYTSRFLFDNYTLIVNEYLDSKRLHQILSDSAEEFRRAGFPEEEEMARVIPVYVFDLNLNTILLLDRYHQSVAFTDMVIAVRTKNTQTVSDYSCNGRHVFTHTRDLERPLVGSILQSMWGVSPTHLAWSSRHNDTIVDYSWSIGQTPFGPFSELSSLSFVQKDAARRNVILTALNSSITSAIDVLNSVAAHGGDRSLLKPKQRTEFIQRWNLFKYKLDKAVSVLSHFDFEMALYYVRSSDHDLYTLHSIVYNASQELEASLVCFKDPPFPWGSVSVSVLLFFAFLYVYTKRDRIFKNKRKQF